jgi:hypothetical protein
MTIKHQNRAWLALLAAALLAGCTTSQTEYSYTGDDSETLSKDDEWVYYRVTGSHIIKRVKKSDVLAGRVPKDPTLIILTPEEFGQLIRPGRRG